MSNYKYHNYYCLKIILYLIHLQYLLYCVAVKKILALRQPKVPFEDLFGGVVYLFLRGMTGSPDGAVHFDPVPIALIEALEEGLNS